MFKKLSYAFMILAVILTVSHNISAHDHHVVREIEHDEHDDDGDDDHSAHTFFSYGHLEDSFLNSKDDASVIHGTPVLDFVHPVAPAIIAPQALVISTSHFGNRPPVICGQASFCSLRAPPVSLI